VFRIVILSIVVGVGPSAGLLCGAWCAPPAASECRHDAPAAATGLSPGMECTPLSVGALPAGREDVRRGAATQTAAALFALTRVPAAVLAGRLTAVAGDPHLAARPSGLMVPLRI